MTSTESVVRRSRQVLDLRKGGERFRYQRMVVALQFMSRLALGAAVVGLVLPDPVGDVASGVAVGVVVAAPLSRVAWLSGRWYLRGDRRYSAVAAALLLVIACGSVVAVVTR